MKANIFADLPAMPADEMMTDLLARPGVRVKRIVSPAGPRRLARSYRLRGAKVATRLNVAHVLEVPGRLAELTEHAAHAGMVIGAVAQHGLRVAPVAQCLQRQTVRVLQPVATNARETCGESARGHFVTVSVRPEAVLQLPTLVGNRLHRVFE